MIKKIMILSIFYTISGYAGGDLEQWFDAIKNNDLNKAKSLIRQVDVNAVDWNESTALMNAVKDGHEDIVKWLLQVPGININLQKKSTGITALILATSVVNKNMVKLLLQAPDININAKDNDGGTALMWAAYRSAKNIAKLLLDAGADPNIKDKDGKTALDLAKPEFKPTLETLIKENKMRQPRLFSGFSIELHSLSKV